LLQDIYVNYKVDVLLKIFSENTGIWDRHGRLVWIKIDENIIDRVNGHTSDGIPQFREIQDDIKPQWWFLKLIFESGEIEVY